MEYELLTWAIIFLIIGLVASLFGFGFIGGTSIYIAKVLAVIFVALFVITVIAYAVKKA